MPSLEEIIQLVTLYKYYLLLPIAVFEGPIITVIAGFLASKGILSLTIAYLVLILGDIIGDTLYYFIGRWGGRPFIKKWGKYFGLSEASVMKMEELFKNHGVKTLLFGKTQAVGGVFLAAAGLSKMPFFKYLWANILGTAVKAMILLFVGYYFGFAYKKIDEYLGIYGEVTLGIIIILLVYFLIKKKKKAIPVIK